MDITPWQNFGLSGMVIGALFLTIWFFGKNVIIRLLELQKEEREEWRATFNTAMQQHNDVIKELTEAITNLRVDGQKTPICPIPPDLTRRQSTRT